ncbi:MAG: T9SS type A sorting domain-containing protein [Saprospiraceae bacterium]|nr:T9SS type A sorting domain-containing protein [Saprospiraceae bacterium]
MYKATIIVCILLVNVNLGLCQFPGPAGTPGSTAIHKDSSIFMNWAKTVELNLGTQDITDPDSPVVSVGLPEFVLGPADGSSVLSLGDGGQVLLSFDPPITNGPGFDFAVFENAFADGFLELAFVEASSDGDYFESFNAISLHPDTFQFDGFTLAMEAEKIHNLAGKYVANYGTPFDLDELEDHPLLDKEFIRYIRITDVVGSVNPDFGSTDSQGTFINDPFPTPFSSCGFDLDGVGVINQLVSASNLDEQQIFSLYPNPFLDFIILDLNKKNDVEKRTGTLTILSLEGKLIMEITDYTCGEAIQTNLLDSGIYILSFRNAFFQLSDRIFRH